MAKQTINIGASPNDGTGTPLRTAFDYTNQNFTELYTATGPSGNNIVVPGNATITGDLTVDTSTLKVDSANNRVGIGTASPTAKLQLAITGSASAITRVNSFGNDGTFGFPSLSANSTGAFFGMGVDQNSPSAGFGFFREATGWNTALAFYTNSQTGGPNIDTITERYRIASDGVATWSNVGGVAGTAMTLNATGLGVGAVPSNYRLYVSAAFASGLNGAYIESGEFNKKSLVVNHTNAAVAVNLFEVQKVGTAQFLVDSSGNVGIGVTPSAWATYKALQIGNGSIANYSPTQDFRISSNAYYASGVWKRIAAAFASQYLLDGSSGTHQWYVAATGAADSTITTFASAAMTLDASGNLLVGVASSGNRLDIQKSTDCAILVKSTGANTNIAMDYVSNYGNLTIRKSGNAVWDFGVINDSSATPAFKISNGPSAVGVQLVSGATAWTTLSDETMKDIIEPISNAVSKVGLLRSVIGKFKTDDASKRRSFLIAQDVQSVLPEAVDVIGENNELGLRYTEVIPLLVAAIKELAAEVNALKKA